MSPLPSCGVADSPLTQNARGQQGPFLCLSSGEWSPPASLLVLQASPPSCSCDSRRCKWILSVLRSPCPPHSSWSSKLSEPFRPTLCNTTVRSSSTVRARSCVLLLRSPMINRAGEGPACLGQRRSTVRLLRCPEWLRRLMTNLGDRIPKLACNGHPSHTGAEMSRIGPIGMAIVYGSLTWKITFFFFFFFFF